MSILGFSALPERVSELFYGKIFKVPDYQRNYSWTEKNWEDFWNDIMDGITTGTTHYWGTITLRPVDENKYCEEEATSYQVYEVVDGQQRITTLYLFIKALINVSKNTILVKKYTKCGDIYRVELGGLNNQFLKDLVDDRKPIPDIKTNRLLKECLEFFENQIRSYTDINAITRYIQESTFSLEFEVANPNVAIKIFESLNDRGKPLTLLDKVKSYLMFVSSKYLGGSLTPKINSVFGNVFTSYDLIKSIGEKTKIDYIRSVRFTEDELLRFFYHYFGYYAITKYPLQNITAYDYDATSEEVFELFLKQGVKTLKATPSHLKNFLLEFLTEFDLFVKAFYDLIQDVDSNCLLKKLFSFLGLNIRIYPLIIASKIKNWLDPNMLKLIEALDLRVYKIRGTDPRASLYKDVISQIKLTKDRTTIENGIKSFINDFMPDPMFQHSLGESLYDNPATKYILWEYESAINPSFNTCDQTLFLNCQKEHVFAQTPKPSFPGFGFKDEVEYFEKINKIGNICLLESTLNKQCQNKLPPDKAKFYQRSNILSTKKLGFDIPLKGFNKNDVIKRTLDIIKFALTRWKVSLVTI